MWNAGLRHCSMTATMQQQQLSMREQNSLLLVRKRNICQNVKHVHVFLFFWLEQDQKLIFMSRCALKFERRVCWPLCTTLLTSLTHRDGDVYCQRATKFTLRLSLTPKWTQVIYSSLFSISPLRFFLLRSLLSFTDTNLSVTDHATRASN